TLANNGSAQATNASANITLPSGLTFVSSDGGSNFDATTGTWTPGTLAASATTTLTIKATVTDGTSQPVTAPITHSDQTDDQTNNNTTNVTVSPVVAKLNLMKSFSSTTATVGSTIVMTVAVGNGGQGKARNVVVTDTLGDGLTLVKALSGTQ